MTNDEFTPFEWFIASLAATTRCTMVYCQAPQRTFIDGDRCADVLYQMHSFGTMHDHCASLFQLQWLCQRNAQFN